MSENKKRWPKLEVIVICLFLLCIIVTAVVLSIQTTRPAQKVELDTNLRSIMLRGSMSIDGGAWLPISDKSPLEADGLHKVVIRGYFPETIDDESSLLVYVNNLKFSMSVNDVTVASFGQDHPENSLLKTPGSTWLEIDASQITSSDMIEINLENVYHSAYKSAWSDFTDSMLLGTKEHLFQVQVLDHIGLWVCGLILVVAGAVALLVSMHCIYYKDMELLLRTLIFALFCIVGGFWFFVDSNYRYLSLVIPYPQYLTLWDIMLLYISQIPIILLCCIIFKQPAHKKIALRFAVAFAVIPCVLFVGQLMNISNMAETQWIIVAATSCWYGCYIIVALREARELKRKKEIFFLFSVAPLVLLALWDCFATYVLRMGHNRLLISVGIVISAFLQLGQLVDFITQSISIRRELQKMKEQQLDDHIKIMLSQIQPHFLYNALASIESLCMTDADKAAEAINSFSQYLRGNMDSLTMNNTVPFHKELEHLTHYLDIEKLRFGKRINIMMDLETDDFKLPVLTIQPLVENAIRYGITKRPQGGTICIRTYSDSQFVFIEIIDNGVGFDPEQIQYDGRSHIGIKNVTSRVQSMCGGALEVESCVGKGTRVMIRIPQTQKEK